MKILVTGAAGFIGYHLVKALAKKGHTVLGIDNLNDYYEISLKKARLNQLGITETLWAEVGKGKTVRSALYPFEFIKGNIADGLLIPQIFETFNPEIVCNLAAQAGVRYSIENPAVYMESNIMGFQNLLEASVKGNVTHFVFASSSSVYGDRSQVPFSVKDRTDEPVSLYAATKRCDEIIAHAYSHLHGLPMTGLRFFTVYGPWGRPDMAMYKFTRLLSEGRTIPVYNEGNQKRDFTYIDDILQGLLLVIEKGFAKKPGEHPDYNIYNIGKGQPDRLLDFIKEIEKNLGITAKLDLLPKQAGDVSMTYSDTSQLVNDYGYHPTTDLKEGVKKFVTWYKSYHGEKNQPKSPDY